MAENKKSFLLYCDLIHTIEQLPNEKAGELFKHILRYVNDMHPKTDDLITKISFEPIKQQLKRDLISWEDKIKDKSTSGRLGNLKRWNIDLYNQVSDKLISLEDAEIIAKSRTVSHTDKNMSLPIAKVAVNDTVNVTVNDTVIKEKKNRDVAKATTQKRISIFKESLFPYTKTQGGIYSVDMVKSFFEYWSELTKNGTKMKWEFEKTFQISGRLARWAKNEHTFSKEPIKNNVYKTTD